MPSQRYPPHPLDWLTRAAEAFGCMGDWPGLMFILKEFREASAPISLWDAYSAAAAKERELQHSHQLTGIGHPTRSTHGAPL